MNMEYSLDLDTDNVCRICLQSEEALISIFTMHIVEGHIKSMPDIIRTCFDIMIKDTTPEFPQQICTTCKKAILDFYNFREKLMRSQAVLQAAFGQPSDDAALLELPEKSSQDQERCEEIEQPTKEGTSQEQEEQYEEIEGERNKTDGESQEEVKMEHNYQEAEIAEMEIEEEVELANDNKSEYVICDLQEDGHDKNQLAEYDINYLSDDASTTGEILPEQIYVNLEEIETAEDQAMEAISVSDSLQSESEDIGKSSKPPLVKRIRKTTKKPGLLSCKVCMKKYEKNNLEHKRIHDALELLADSLDYFRCLKCPQTFFKATDLENHKQTHQNDEKLDKNDDGQYTDVQFLEDDDSEQLLVCGVCNIEYKSVKFLKCHMVTHLDNFNCPYSSCGYQYSTYRSFIIHINTQHSVEGQFSCKNCGKENIKNFDSLRQHYKNCSVKFSCKQCGKKFISEKSLYTHEKYRHAVKTIVCDYCGKTFASSTELDIHVRVHTGLRPFACTICGKTYKTLSMRATHMDSHSQLALLCSICNKTLKSRRCFQQHLKRHTEEKKHKCEACGKKFFTKWHVKEHFSKMHKLRE